MKIKFGIEADSSSGRRYGQYFRQQKLRGQASVAGVSYTWLQNIPFPSLKATRRWRPLKLYLFHQQQYIRLIIKKGIGEAAAVTWSRSLNSGLRRPSSIKNNDLAVAGGPTKR